MNGAHKVAEKMVNSNSQSNPDTQQHAYQLILARTVWVVIVVLAVTLWVADILPGYAQYLKVCTQSLCPNQLATPYMERSLHSAGLSLQFYATYLTTLQIVFVLIFCGSCLFSFWEEVSSSQIRLSI